MKKSYYLFYIGCVFFMEACAPFSAQPKNRVCFQKKCFDVEIAYRPGELARGLQFRKSLDERKGMLFVFQQPSRHRFWMKDTLIPLDMIWLDYAGHIVHIAEEVPPCKSDPCPTYDPGQNASYVLEINAGMAKRVGMTIGERLDIQCQL